MDACLCNFFLKFVFFCFPLASVFFFWMDHLSGKPKLISLKQSMELVNTDLKWIIYFNFCKPLDHNYLISFKSIKKLFSGQSSDQAPCFLLSIMLLRSSYCLTVCLTYEKQSSTRFCKMMLADFNNFNVIHLYLVILLTDSSGVSLLITLFSFSG